MSSMPKKYVDSVFLHMGTERYYWTPQSIIRTPKVIIVVFQDSVSKETIEKYAADVVANGKDISFRLKTRKLVS